LPAFTLGQLAYFYTGPGDSPEVPMRSYRELLQKGLTNDLARVEKAKLLETVLRSTGQDALAEAADLLVTRWQALRHTRQELLGLFRTLFEQVALSPYTDFVDKTLAFLELLVEGGHLDAAERVDFLGYLLRHLGRHLTAYDLVKFHHRGANYPDALLLDAALKRFLQQAERHPDLFQPSPGDGDERQKRKRLRRRALRQGCLLRRTYEGLPVPQSPTSPGENARILPPPHVRVPEEEITDPARRSRKLFAGDPLPQYLGGRVRGLLHQSLLDLSHPAELKELGMALFLDRPLGAFKAPAEPDQTLLLSYEAFSRSVAERRLRQMEEDPDLFEDKSLCEQAGGALRDLKVEGLRVAPAVASLRPGAVSVQDADRVAGDFLFLRTTRGSLNDFLNQFDFTPLRQRCGCGFLQTGERVLVLRGASSPGMPEGSLVVYDAALRQRIELQIDGGQGYETRGGSEYPKAGLRVVRVWEPSDEGGWREVRLEAEHFALRLCP
jgi:hypothetical protein